MVKRPSLKFLSLFSGALSGLIGGFAAVALAYTVTANMSLKIPSSGDTDYPTSIADSFTLIDQHDHSSGKGLPIGTAGLSDSAVNAAKIADGTVSATELAASVAGNGLTGGAGTPLAANVDGSTLEINADTLRVKDAGITPAKLSAPNYQRAAISGVVPFSGASWVDVSGLSVNLTTVGRVVQVTFSHTDSPTIPSPIALRMLRGGTVIGYHAPNNTAHSLHVTDQPGAGTHTYKMQIAHLGGGAGGTLVNAAISAIEL